MGIASANLERCEPDACTSRKILPKQRNESKIKLAKQAKRAKLAKDAKCAKEFSGKFGIFGTFGGFDSCK